jgi:hypothetical protein
MTLQNLDTHLASKIGIRNELDRIRKEVKFNLNFKSNFFSNEIAS